MTRRVAVYMGCRNYYPMMLAASKSLLYHNRMDRIYFLIEDDADSKFALSLPLVYRCINVSNQQFFSYKCPNINSYTYMTLMRTTLSKLFPDEHKVLLLDPDTIVTDNIDELWETDLNGYYFAAVQETRNHSHTHCPYFNAGVMLMNLDKFREDGMDDKVIAEINRKRYTHMEQDVLNFLCDGKIKKLPSMYMACFVTDETEHEKIHHYLANEKRNFWDKGVFYHDVPFEQVNNEKRGKGGRW